MICSHFHGNNFSFRLAVAVRCPKGEIEDLWMRFNNPCLYICENSCQIGMKHACRTYAIPLSCIRLVTASMLHANIVTNNSFRLTKPLFVL